MKHLLLILISITFYGNIIYAQLALIKPTPEKEVMLSVSVILKGGNSYKTLYSLSKDLIEGSSKSSYLNECIEEGPSKKSCSCTLYCSSPINCQRFFDYWRGVTEVLQSKEIFTTEDWIDMLNIARGLGLEDQKYKFYCELPESSLAEIEKRFEDLSSHSADGEFDVLNSPSALKRWRVSSALGKCELPEPKKPYSLNSFNLVPRELVIKLFELESKIPSESEFDERRKSFTLECLNNKFNPKNKLISARARWKDCSGTSISIFKEKEGEWLLVGFSGFTKFLKKRAKKPDELSVFREEKTDIQEKNVINASWFKEQNILAIAEGDHISIYTEDGGGAATPCECESEVTSLAWQNAVNDNKYHVASGCIKGVLYVHEGEKGTLLFSSQLHTEAITNISWSPYNKFIATMSEDGRVGVTDVDTQETVYLKTPHKEKINDGCWDSSYRFFIAGTDDGNLLIWNIEKKELVYQYPVRKAWRFFLEEKIKKESPDFSCLREQKMLSQMDHNLKESVQSISLSSDDVLAVTTLNYIYYFKSFSQLLKNTDKFFEK